MKQFFKAIVQGLIDLVQRMRIRRKVRRIKRGKQTLKPGYLNVSKYKRTLKKKYPHVKGNKEIAIKARSKAVRKMLKHYGAKVPPWPRNLNGGPAPVTSAYLSHLYELLAEVAEGRNVKARAKKKRWRHGKTETV